MLWSRAPTWLRLCCGKQWRRCPVKAVSFKWSTRGLLMRVASIVCGHCKRNDRTYGTITIVGVADYFDAACLPYYFEPDPNGFSGTLPTSRYFLPPGAP